VEGHAEAYSVVKVGSVLPVVVKGKGAYANDPYDCRVAKVLPK